MNSERATLDRVLCSVRNWKYEGGLHWEGNDNDDGSATCCARVLLQRTLSNRGYGFCGIKLDLETES